MGGRALGRAELRYGGQILPNSPTKRKGWLTARRQIQGGWYGYP
jgi:hypothetical protein